MQFTATVNSEPVEQALRVFQASLAEQSPALTEIADDLRAMVTEQFASEGRAGGTPWAELAPSTARRRRAGTLLLNTTGAGYGQTLLPGPTKGRRGLPMRPLIVLTPARSDQWTELVRQHLEENTPLLGTKQLGG